MNTFVWNDSFKTGETIVDTEHQELFRIINQVADLQEGAESSDTIREVLDHLVRYAVNHFAHEEKLMADVACDPRHVQKHRAAHVDFAKQVVAMRKVGTGANDIELLLRFLSNWLAFHILGMDQVMARQVRAIREGIAPAVAFETELGKAVDPATSSLLEALNSLYRVVASRNHALMELNENLETAVTKRTRELTATNAQLLEEQVELKAAMAAVAKTQQQLLESERQRREEAERHMQQLLAQIVDGDPVPTLVINSDHKVTHWNKACATVTGKSAESMIGSSLQWSAFYPAQRPILADLVVTGAIHEMARLYEGKFRRSMLVANAYEAEDFFPQFGEGGRWLYFTAAPLHDASGKIIGAIETLQDVTERRRAEENLREYQVHLEELVEKRTVQLADANRQLAQDAVQRQAAEAELLRRYAELTELNIQLSETKEQLVQSEKLASIGQLAAGVAHEINNPIGYVHSNLGALEKYLADLFTMLETYESSETAITVPEVLAKVKGLREQLDLQFLKEDIPTLMQESKEGISRVKKIVQDLKDFSRVDTSQEWQLTDLHQGIDSTINIVANEIKYKADIVKEYGRLPPVECLPSQLNQVFMNLLVNAAQAMGDQRGCITIRTGAAGDYVWLEFTDNGCGMPPEIQQKVFDPFFTTKPVGKGTGLGLSLAYGIIQDHCGRIDLESQPGHGTTFRVTLPIHHPTAPADPANGSQS